MRSRGLILAQAALLTAAAMPRVPGDPLPAPPVSGLVGPASADGPQPTAAATGAGEAARPRLGVADSMTATRAVVGTAPAGDRAAPEVIGWGQPIRVELARREFEPVQLVIEASPQAPLEDLAVTVGPLRRVETGLSPGRAVRRWLGALPLNRRRGRALDVWPAGHIALWHVATVEVYNLWEPHQSLGWFPDPLMPVDGPFAVPAGGRRVVWVCFHAPPDLGSGIYRGRLTVTAGGRAVGQVEVEVTVWDFALPIEQNFALVIPIWGGHLEAMYPGSQTPERRQAYLDMLYDHRVAPIALDLDDDREVEHAIARGVRDFNLACFPRDSVARETAVRVGGIAARWREKGWDRQTRPYVLLGDEAPREDYAHLREQGRLIAEVAPGVARRWTVHDQMFGQVPWIAEQMRGLADTAIPAAAPCYPVENLTRAFREAGFGVWWYHVAAHFYIPSGDTIAEARLSLWRHWKYHVPGQLHWGMTYWGDTNIRGQDGRTWPDIPWDTRDSRAGDGYLVYPAPGGTACWPSIRLEQLRDGIEDYEYFHLLEELTRRLEETAPAQRTEGRRAENRRLLAMEEGPIASYTEYPVRPEVYRACRARLARAIIAARRLLGED